QALLFVQQKDRKRVVVDLLFDRSRDFVNQFVDFESRTHFKADVIKQRQQFAVPALAFIDAGIFDRDSDLAGKQIEQLDLIFAEILRHGALDIENTNDSILADERNGELGPDVFHRFDVSRIFADVVDDNGRPLHGGRSSHTVSDLDAEIFDDVRLVADGEPEVEFLLVVVEKEY